MSTTEARLEVSTDAIPNEPAPLRQYWARFGSFILTTELDTIADEDLHGRLIDALAADNRVSNIERGSMDPEWTRKYVVYPRASEQLMDDLLSGADHRHTVRFSGALMFTINVPVKNQPSIHGTIPASDSYDVAWDGCTAVVIWQRGEERYPAIAGGQILVEVLRTAAATAGAGLYVQACSPGCQHLFAHAEIKLDEFLSEKRDLSFGSAGPRPLLLTARGSYSDLELVEAVHDALAVPSGDFARLKNVARRLLDIESAARRMSADLISHDYITLTRSRGNILQRIGYSLGELWFTLIGRGRKHHASVLIASLWLAMASMDILQRNFNEIYREFQSSVSRHGSPRLYEIDLQPDTADVENLEPQFARAAVEHKSARLDNHGVVLATVIGAVGGAILTGVGSGLLK